MSLPVLYGTRFCPYVQRARIVFAMVGRAYTFKAIDLLHKPKSLADISPYGKVPVLVVEEGHIHESAAINQYIDEKWGKSALMGQDPYERAMHRVWTHWCNTRAVPAIYNAMFNRDVALDAEMLKRVDEQFGFLNQHLESGRGGPFIRGDKFQFSDVMVAPFLKRLPLLEHFKGYETPSASKFPRVAELVKAVDKELALHPLEDVPLDAKTLIEAYKPYILGEQTLDPNYWSY